MVSEMVTRTHFQEIWDEACKAGRDAVEKLNVVPMVVQEHQNMLDDKSPVAQSWFVADGVCGFAWINIRPASRVGRNDCDFAKWCRANRIGSYDDYAKAWNIWVSDYNQSMQKKEAYADAAASVLQKYGIRAYSGSRMD
jgi:hypothetical protein